MRIESKGKSVSKAGFWIYSLLMIAAGALFAEDGIYALLPWAICTIIVISGLFLHWMATGRTFWFDETGYTVVFGKYRRHYCWSDVTVRYEDLCDNSHTPLVKSAIVFLPKNADTKRYLKMGLGRYCRTVRPLSFAYVELEEQGAELERKTSYTAPKREFVETLLSFGIEVEALPPTDHLFAPLTLGDEIKVTPPNNVELSLAISLCAVALLFIAVVVLALLCDFYWLLLVLSVPVTIFLLWMVYCCLMTFCRSYSFDAQGCTVSLGKWKKRYTWHQLPYVSYVNCRDLSFRMGDHRYTVPYTAGLLFSTKPIKRPQWLDISAYCVFHSQTSFFVVFYRDKQSETRTYQQVYQKIHPLPQADFIRKLKEWNVCIGDD